MANTCVNYIAILSYDIEGLKKISDFFDGEDNKLSFFCEKAGLDKEHYYLRGTLNYVEFVPDDDRVVLQVESAWTPAVRLVRDIAKMFVPDCDVVYSSEECSNELYYTNDPCYCGLYDIDVWNRDKLEKMNATIDIESDDSATESEALKLLNRILNTDLTDIDALIKQLRESEYNDIVYVNPWREMSIDEADGRR